MLDPDSLAAFVAFAERMNFTQAAKRLHVSQPALHARIRRLGEQLEVALYQREGRRLVLTRHGEALVRYAREQDRQAREFMAELRERKAPSAVVLAAGEGSYLYLLGEPIRRFVRKAEQPLRLLTRDREGTLAALRSGEAQLGVAALDALPDDLASRALCEVPQLLVMPADHPLAKRRKIAASDLEGVRLIVAPAGRPHRAMIDTMLTGAGVRWEVAVETHGWPAMIQFVKLGVGLAVVNGSVTLARGLVGRPIPALASTHYFLVHPRRIASGAASLAELIVAHAGR
ncbi:LysR family transcriptional regulator [Nannocystaceae bacterium ST9]